MKRRCLGDGCRELVDVPATRCAEHELERSARDNARRHRRQRDHGRDSARWRRLRAERLELAGHRCELRLAGCRDVATTVHLDPALAGDHLAATIDDVLAACSRCHGRIDAPRARARARPSSSEKTSEGGPSRS